MMVLWMVLVKKKLVMVKETSVLISWYLLKRRRVLVVPGRPKHVGPSASAGRHLTQEEAAKEELAIRISQRYALLEEERLLIKTMAYNDKYKMILDEIWKDKVELDGKTMKEDEEAVKRIKGEALKEKEDPGAFIFPIRLEGKVNENALVDTGSDINTMPYRIFETLGREDIKKVDRGITMIDHTQAETMGKLSNVLCQVGVTTIIAKFIVLDIPIDRDSPIVVGQGFLPARFDVPRTAESDSDDEEEYVIKRNKFRAPIYGPRPPPYLNCANSEDRSSTIQAVTNPFRKISVWEKAVSFLGSLPVPLKQVNWKPDYKGSYTKEEEAAGQWLTEIRLTDPLQERTTEKPDRHDPNAQEMKPLAQLLPRHIYLPCIVNWDVLNRMGCDWEIDDMLRIRVREPESEEEIFTSVAWIKVFNINEPIYAEFCHGFYSTYEFDEVCANDELQSKKIIRFRLGGRAHSLTLLEFARRLGLYKAVELEEDGFNVYFEGGLRSDDNFNATDY
ncbi:gag protease polyprotein [Tanacetum coccineum]